MNWEAISAIAETIGVAAVFMSLAYIAIQIRQNTRQISRGIEADELSALERNVQADHNLRESIIPNPELTELFVNGLKSFERLSEVEQFRFSLLLRNWFSAYQGGYMRQLSLQHDPLGLESLGRLIDKMPINGGAREWLEHADPDWRPEFRSFIEERLKGVKAGGDVATSPPSI